MVWFKFCLLLTMVVLKNNLLIRSCFLTREDLKRIGFSLVAKLQALTNMKRHKFDKRQNKTDKHTAKRP